MSGTVDAVGAPTKPQLMILRWLARVPMGLFHRLSTGAARGIRTTDPINVDRCLMPPAQAGTFTPVCTFNFAYPESKGC